LKTVPRIKPRVPVLMLALLCVLIAAAGTATAWRIHAQSQPC
jgi:hypothetical protein